jgi:hypothetical protein
MPPSSSSLLSRLRSPTPTVSTVDPLEGTKLGEYVHRDANLLRKLGWKRFVLARRRRGDLASCLHLDHPAASLLQMLGTDGAPV